MTILSSIAVWLLESSLGQAVFKFVWDRLAAALTSWIADQKAKAAVAAAIKKAVDQKDQTDVEHVIGNPTPGGPSGIPGVSVVDALPGVPKS